MEKTQFWIDCIIELQSLAQAGLAYCKNDYDKERYARIRAISAEMMANVSYLPSEQIVKLFCNEDGYQTPKIDTRAAIFKDNKILLVHENNGFWSLPGGWCDVNVSVAENTVKEVKEEAGLEVIAEKLIAVQDWRKHNVTNYAYGVCKIFIQCSVVGGRFSENIETTEYAYFPIDKLPGLAVEKNTAEQIQMCFDAFRAGNAWKVYVD